MTDNEIIKALEWHISPVHCNGRQYYSDKVECSRELIENALDLINRQQAEIEEAEHNIELLYRLKEGLKDDVNTIRKENEGLLYKIKSCNSEIKRLKSIIVDTHKIVKAEAITEFWRSLKEQAYISNLSLTGEYVIDVSDGENIVKEMVGE